MSKSRREQLEELLADSPDDPELRYMIAMEQASEGNDEQAVRAFEEVIHLYPQYAPAYHQAGRTLVRLDRIDQARAVLQRGIPIAQAQGNLHAAGEMTELLGSIGE